VNTQPELILTGPADDHGPSLGDLVPMFKHLTGREPDAADVERAHAVLEAGTARR
jgi:hypothetical protein